MPPLPNAAETRSPTPEAEALAQSRWELLDRVIDVFDVPMAVLGLVWLLLLVVDLTRGLSPLLDWMSAAIWILFILDFAAELLVAPHRGEYLRRHWMAALSLALPAVRVLRVVRTWRGLMALRAARGARLLRVVSGINRGMGALAATMGRRGFGYAVALTAIVTLAGAAGMYGFERNSGLSSYGASLWWTAMIMTTLGSEYWPHSAEGRVLCLLLSLYALAVFGYVTAALASFFVDRDASRPDAAVAGADAIEALQREIAALREDVRQLRLERPQVD